MEPTKPADHAEQSICTLGYRRRGEASIVIGILLHDAVQNRLWLEFPPGIDQFIASDDLDIFEMLAQDLRDKAEEMGPSALLAYLQDNLSNTLIISDPLAVGAMANPRRFLQSLSCVFGTEWPATTSIRDMLGNI